MTTSSHIAPSLSFVIILLYLMMIHSFSGWYSVGYYSGKKSTTESESV